MDHPSDVVIYHNASINAEASSTHGLLHRLTAILQPTTSVADLPTGATAMVAAFHDALSQYASQSGDGTSTFVVVDGLEQLTGSVAAACAWFPAELPSNTRFIVTSRPGAAATSLRGRTECAVVSVAPLSTEERTSLIQAWANSSRRDAVVFCQESTEVQQFFNTPASLNPGVLSAFFAVSSSRMIMAAIKVVHLAITVAKQQIGVRSSVTPPRTHTHTSRAPAAVVAHS